MRLSFYFNRIITVNNYNLQLKVTGLLFTSLNLYNSVKNL